MANGKYRDPELIVTIQQKCLTAASQTCHHPRLDEKAETKLCRGARDFQLEIFARLGLLTEPTDEAWEARSHRSSNEE